MRGTVAKKLRKDARISCLPFTTKLYWGQHNPRAKRKSTRTGIYASYPIGSFRQTYKEFKKAYKSGGRV